MVNKKPIYISNKKSDPQVASSYYMAVSGAL